MTKKLGDIMDGLLWAEGLAYQHAEPEQVSDYPETVLETLRLFNRIFMLPRASIPPKYIKGRYEQWVKELQALNEVAGNSKLMLEAMTIAREMYDQLKKRFIISHPLAIKNLLIDAVGQINRNKPIEKPEVEKVIISEVASVESTKKTIRDLKSLFKDED